MNLGNLWKDPPFPTSGAKKEMLAWVITCNANEARRWQIIALSVMVTFITYIATGKLVWGVP